ncbi:flagellar hook-length control protein FliK [Neobacillus soli]|uniref:flagellar hook-length control protein FliK n=1 Tax=Neobacillus soli TaxID=220688 RepID=UPI0012ED251C|nr:flagellar hook-length control protein FliK [Neobacillus soli]
MQPTQQKIPDKDSSSKQGGQSATAFLELLNELIQENNQDSPHDLLAMVNTLFQTISEQSNQPETFVNQKNNEEETPNKEPQTRDDMISFISLLFKNEIDRNDPSFAQLEKQLQNIDPNKATLAQLEKVFSKKNQQETITFEKIAKLLAEVATPGKEGIPTVQHGQKAVEDSFKFKLTENSPVPDFDFQRQFEGKEVIFQSFQPNGAASAVGKSEQAQLPKVSVQQFFSEVIDLVKNQASLKKASEFIEAKFSLTPEKLGDIDVKLSIHKGQVFAHFTAETLIGKETLESQISLLRSSLTQQGFQVDKIEVSLAGQGLQHSFSQQEEKSRQEQSQQRFSKKKISAEDFYQSHSTIEEYHHSQTENTINILA